VEENLRFFASLYGLPEISTRMDTLCRQLDLLKKRNTRAKFLSRGFLQRLAIARALMHEPTLLLLDEPFTGLDTRAISRFVELLQGMKFKSVLLTTHRFDFDKKLGNRALILNQGQLICDTRQEGLENADWEKIYLDRTSQSQTAARGA
jgi:heme exporter protein A